MIMSYFKDWKIRIGKYYRNDCELWHSQKLVRIGPFLWNIYYDNLWRLLFLERIGLLGYADNLVIIDRGKTGWMSENKYRQAVCMY